MSQQPGGSNRGIFPPQGAQAAPGSVPMRDECDAIIRVVVFDMDGVLLNSEGAWLQARRDYARSLGRVWTDADHAASMGGNLAGGSRLMVERLELDRTPDQVAQDMLARMQAPYAQQLPACPGAVEAVRRMAAAYRLGLATGSPRALAEPALRRLGLHDSFSVRVYGDMVVRGKPAPDIYRMALDRLGVKAAHAVGVEDSANGLRALHAAGLGRIAVLDPAFPPEPGALALAAVRLDHLDQLDVRAVQAAGRARADAVLPPEPL